MNNIHNFDIIDVEYEYTIEKIYHISDIHIRLSTRHNEYQEVFNKFYDILLNEPNKKNSIVIITGDILHSKTELNPECVKITRDFFQSIVNIMNVIIIAGNHDANLANSNRLDSLTPLVDRITQPTLDIDNLADLNFVRYLYYLKDSGVYKFGNIYFSLASVFDYSLIEAHHIRQKIENENKKEYQHLLNGNHKLIALYHGSFKEAITDTGAKMEDCSKITLNHIKQFDYGLLGDIHKHQFLDNNCKIAYAGSMIQQNHSEEIKGHGILLWNLLNGKSELIEIENQYGFLTIRIRGNKIVDDLKSNNYSRLKKVYLRVIKEDIINSQDFETLLKQFQNETGLEILRCQDYSSSGIGSNDKNINIQDEQKIKINLTNVKEQNQLIIDYLKTNKKKNVSINIETGQKSKTGKPIINSVWNDKLLEDICQYNQENNLEIDNNSDESQVITNSRWKLKKLEFSNLFSYGENNQIDFTKLNGIVGIVGLNHIGKSSILDIILYCIYDKISRKGTIKEIINNQSDNFDCKIEIEMGSHIYGIRKHGKKDIPKKDNKDIKQNTIVKIPVKITFWKTDLDGNNRKSLTGETPQDTKKIIEKYFGTYDDMVLTNISLQNNNTRFADSTNMDRKKELEKLIKIEIFEKLKDISSKKHLEKQSIIKFLEKDNPSDKNDKYLKELLTFQCDLEIIKTKLDGVIKSIDTKTQEISQTQLEYNPSVQKINQTEFRNLLIEKSELDSKFGDYCQFDELTINNMINTIYDKHNKWIDKINMELETIEQKIEEKFNMKTNIDNQQFNQLKNTINEKKNTLDKIKKDINSLELLEENNNKIISEIKILKEKINLYEKLLSDNIILEEITNWLNSRLKHILNVSNHSNISLSDIHHNLIIHNDELNKLKRKTKTQKDNILYTTYLLEDVKYWIDKFNNNNNSDVNNSDVNNSDVNNSDVNNDKSSLEIEIANIISKIGELEEQVNVNNKKIDKYGDIKIKHLIIETELNEKNNLLNDIKSKIMINNNLDDQINQLKQEKIQIKKTDDLDYILFHKWIDVSRTFNDFNQNYLIIERLNNQEKELNQLKSIEKELRNEEKNISEAIASIEVDLERTKDKLNELNSRKDSIEIDKLYLDSVKNLPYKLIEQICPKLEEKVNKILVSLVDFTLVFIVDGNDFNVYLKRNNNMIQLSNSSGFEKFISSLIIRVALIMISNLPKPNFLAIDEGWSNFDSENINNIGLIFEYLKIHFDFVLIISHIQPLRSHLDMSIDIKKNNKLSHVYI